MKKRLLLLIIFVGMIFSLAFVKTNKVVQAAEGCDLTNFTNEFSWGVMQPTCNLNDDGNTEIIVDPSSWGQRLRYRYMLDYTDMLLDLNIPKMERGEVIVLLFTTNNESWIGEAENFVVRFYRGGKNEFDPVSEDEINFLIGPNHDPNNAVIEFSTRYVEGDNPFIIEVNKNDNYDFILTYRSTDNDELVEDDVYTVDNATFKSWINSDIPSGGLVIGGFERPGGTDPSKIIFNEISDTFSREYEANQKVEVENAVNSYETSSFTSIEDLDDFLNLRNTAISQIETNARVYDKTLFNNRINIKDAEIASDETLTGIVADKVLTQLSALETLILSLENEENITETNLTNYQTTLTNISNEALSLKTLLSVEKQEEINAQISDLQYELDKATILLTIINYEEAVNAEEYGKVSPERIVELKALQQLVDIEAINSLREEDKLALETRYNEVNSTLEELELSISGEVKELYVASFEDAVDEDLTNYQNILSAIAARQEVVDNVVFLDTDTNLKARFDAANAILNTAIDTYMLAELNDLIGSFADEDSLNDYNDYKAVSDRFFALDLTLVAENSEAKADIEAKYENVKTLLENHILYGFSHYGMEELYVSDEGIYTKGAAEHPRRTNFDLPFDIVDSEVIIRFSEIAYYNVEDDEPDKGANNIVVNLLNKPNAYKSADETYGFSIMFWLFPVETNVQVYNNTDISLGSVAIPTPMIDEDIVIKVSIEDLYGSEYWVIDINGYIIEIPTSGPAGVAKDLFVDNQAYFSIASYADVPTEKNAFTIIKIDDYEFGKVNEPIDNNDNDNDDNNIGDDNLSDNDEKDFNFVPIIIIGIVVLGGAGTYLFIRSRKG